MDFTIIGPILVLGLSAIGCSIGCGIAGAVSHAIMSRTEEARAKYIAMSAAPSSQIIYGFVLMLKMTQSIQAGTLDPLNAIGIGLFAGLGIMLSSIYQGKVCASGMQASIRTPAVYGLCWASIGIIESFALFTMVFSLMLIP